MRPQRTGHAPGWSWRRRYAGRCDRPYPGTSTRVGGLCESGWHADCPQAPLDGEPAPTGQCLCACHLEPL